MIVDHISRIDRYAGLGESFRTAARWLRETDLHALTPGNFEIDGENVFASLADNVLDREEPAYEAHHRYADIQLILSGKERFFLGWEGREGAGAPGSDFFPCEADRALELTLEADQFVIFLPGEMHAPGNPAQAPAVCRKLVVKVRTD